MLADTYQTPTRLPWDAFAAHWERAEEGLARLDERLRKNPFAEGWAERAHYADACAALWLDGELVHLEDLVLRDAAMDVRTGSHALTRAMSVLRARRLAARRDPAWILSPEGSASLRRRVRKTDGAGEGPALEKPDLIYEPDRDEDARLGEWREVVTQTKGFPALIAAAIAHDAWRRIAPFQRGGWLGPVLAAALLKQRSKTKHHLLALNLGARDAHYRRAHFHDAGERIAGFLDWVSSAAAAGHKDLDKLALARELMSVKLKGRRSTSRLPDLVDLILTKPLISVPLAAKHLKVSPQAVEGMLKELGSTPREITGRGRYRAWAIV